MTTKQAKQLGMQHAIDGKELTPFACREIDAQIFAAVRETERPAKEYAKIRGAFNRAWEAQYYALVSA
jgi:hypothetical protein